MSDPKTSGRKTDRTSARIRAEVIQKKVVDTTTINVSRNGIFLKDVTERNVNSLLRVRLYLPPAQKPIEIFGRVAWKGKVAGANGVGIHFLNLESNDRTRWVEFISEIESMTGASIQLNEPVTGQVSVPTDSAASRPAARAKTAASFMVRFKSLERLKEFLDRDVGKGEMFLKTPVLRTIGEKVQVVLIHPDTDKDLELQAEVAHLQEHATTDRPKGMGLRFVELSEETKAALEEFAKKA